MTNQAGRGAWRDYQVLAQFALPISPVPGISKTYRAAAVHACGTRVANRSWVVILGFPRAQSAFLGTSAAYVARTKHGLSIWRQQIVR